MTRFIHGNMFSLFQVQGFNWLQLSQREQHRLHQSFVAPSFQGYSPHTYGFTKVQFNGQLYYGGFTQHYEQSLRSYSIPAVELTSVEPSFEDRQFIYIPAQHILVLERRKFSQTRLTQQDTKERIETLLGSAVGNYLVTLEPYKQTISRERLREEFIGNPTTRIRAVGLNNMRVDDDFKFFNPHVERNAISRQLFNEKILPTTYAIELSSRDPRQRQANPSHDLRQNPLAHLLFQVASEISELEIFDEKLNGRRILRSQYDDRLDIASDYDTPADLVHALLERTADLPLLKPDIRVKRQLPFPFDE